METKNKGNLCALILVVILASCSPANMLAPAKSSSDTGVVIPSEIASPSCTINTTSTPLSSSVTETLLPTTHTVVPTLNPAQKMEQEEIKTIIEQYFDIYYQALSTSPPAAFEEKGFGDLISDLPEARDFEEIEVAKLQVQAKYWELNKLRYVDYKHTQEYDSYSSDQETGQVTVYLLDKAEVIRERSLEEDPNDPRVTILEFRHIVILQKEGEDWSIVSDSYFDSWWQQFRKPGATKEDILSTMNLEREKIAETNYQPVAVYQKSDFSCEFDPDPSSHTYNRTDAVEYAQDHAFEADYNLDYPEYDPYISTPDPTPFGDCTNFVSQAIYERGDGSMFLTAPIHPRSPDGQPGWYLLNGMQRASDWNHVGGSPLLHGFFDFVLENEPSQYISEGPEGCEADYISDLDIGDVIQYDWEDDGYWDHSVIVVGWEGGIVQVASHSPNFPQDDYDFRTYEDIRYIHIERSDGEVPVNTRVYDFSDDAGINPGDCTFSLFDNEVYLGNCFNGGDITSGFRFENIEIPKDADIKYAAITFAVDGEYTHQITVKIYGEASGNSNEFSEEDPPHNRPTTSEESAVLWDIKETWNLTNNHDSRPSYYSFTTPQLRSVIEEIVGQGDWAWGNSLAIIIKNAGTGTLHRRVIASERADWDPYLSSARLIVAYSGGTPPPTDTPTPTPSPTPTPTPTPTYTPTPTITPTLTPTFTPSPTSSPGWAAAEQALMKDEPIEKNMAFSSMLSQFRDQVMSDSSKGNDYVETVYQHAPEIMLLFLQNEAVRLEAKALALDVQPLIESMLDDQVISSPPHLDKDWVDKAIDLLTEVENQVGSELWEEIQWCKDNLPNYVGKTGDEIWKMLPDRSLELDK